MNFEVVSRTKLEGNSEELIIKIDKNNLQLLGYVLETIEGMCYYSTIDKDKDDSRVKIIYTIDFKADIDKILQSIKEHE